MASIPLASTSRAVFVPSSSSRLLRRSLFQASSATASTSSISHRSQRHEQQQQCRHASSAPQGATSKHMHDDGMQNIPPQSFFHQHGSVGGSGHQIPLPPAIASKKEAGTSELKWMAKQMDLLERRDNKKTDIPVKQDEDLPFALYAPPTSIPFRLLSEHWWTYWFGRFQNTLQSFNAAKNVFGLRRYQQTKKKIMTEQLIPLYKEVCRAQATGNITPVLARLSYTLRNTLQTQSLKLLGRRNATANWKWHGLQGAKVVSMRQVEFAKGQATMQMTVRLESKQSLEIRDRTGALMPGSGSHDKPQKVTENYVFQKKIHLGEDEPWIVVRSIPTLTPLQAIGKTDKRFHAATKHKRRVALTVAA